MEGVNILQKIPGASNVVLIICGCLCGVLAIFCFIFLIYEIISNKEAIFSFLVTTGCISITIIIFIINYDYKYQNCYYYATIEDSVSLKEFDKYYTIIKHEDNSELWLIKEKEISENDN